MIWVVWRQHRAESLIVVSVLVLAAIYLLITGMNMASTFQHIGLGTCLAQASDRSRCGSLEEVFKRQYGFLATLPGLAIILPVLLGILVGAPLVAREIEQGTHRLIWMQSITRIRWLSTKLIVVLAASLLGASILMGLLIWWYSPFGQFNGYFNPASFDVSGPVFLASTVLVLTLGFFAGALTRRTVLAMAVTLALFLAIRLPVEFSLRPHYLPPITETWSLTQQSPPHHDDQDWTVAMGLEDSHGNTINGLDCNGTETLQQCLQANGATANYLTYQPADRFWTFQWIETGIYLAFSALALTLTVWLVRQHLS